MTAPHTHTVVPGVLPGPGMCPACDAAERRRLHDLVTLLESGAPWPLAREALASTRLDRDPEGGTHEVRDQPAWLREDPDGFRIVDRD